MSFVSKFVSDSSVSVNFAARFFSLVSALETSVYDRSWFSPTGFSCFDPPAGDENSTRLLPLSGSGPALVLASSTKLSTFNPSFNPKF